MPPIDTVLEWKVQQPYVSRSDQGCVWKLQGTATELASADGEGFIKTAPNVRSADSDEAMQEQVAAPPLSQPQNIADLIKSRPK